MCTKKVLADKQTDRQTDRLTDSLTDRHRLTIRQTETDR